MRDSDCNGGFFIFFFLVYNAGVRNMAQAYMASGGKERDAALGKVKAGYKECSQNMCSLEAQLESLMGSLEMRMKGVCIFSFFPLLLVNFSKFWRFF